MFVEQTTDEFFEEHGSILTEIDMMFSRPDYLRIVSQVTKSSSPHMARLKLPSSQKKPKIFYPEGSIMQLIGDTK